MDVLLQQSEEQRGAADVDASAGERGPCALCTLHVPALPRALCLLGRCGRPAASAVRGGWVCRPLLLRVKKCLWKGSKTKLPQVGNSNSINGNIKTENIPAATKNIPLFRFIDLCGDVKYIISA